MGYNKISEIYDLFCDGFDYSHYLNRIFLKCSELPNKGLALDCGCGTGSLMLELFKRGYDCSGVDSSLDMLQICGNKLEEAGFSAHLINQELNEIDLFGAYDLVFCSMDTVNHILNKRTLKQFFSRLYNFIEPNGYFIFDIKTKKAFEKIKESQIYEKEEDTLIIKGDFDGKNAFYDITAFIAENNDLYKKINEYVEERYYENAEIKDMLDILKYSFIEKINYKDRTIFIYKK